MEKEVQKTDEKVESKETELNLETLFGNQEDKETSDKTDDKSADDKSTSSSEESEGDDPKELQAKLDALTKELNRVRKGKAESSAEVQEVREQLANLKGQLEVMSKGKSSEDSGDTRLAKYTDEQLLQGQTEWEDSLYEERMAARQARVDNDEPAYNKAKRSEGVAKTTLNSIRKELLERSKRVGAEQAKAQTDANELVQEIAGLYEEAYDAFPDLKEKGSDIWNAGNEVYNRHPKLMKQLGPMAELVATALAITENPKLIPGGGAAKVKEARKDLLTEINAQAEKSFIKGKGTPNKKVVPDFAAMPARDFEGLIHKLKQG